MMSIAFISVIIFYHLNVKMGISHGEHLILERTSFNIYISMYHFIQSFLAIHIRKSHASLETAFSIYPHHVTIDKIVEHTVFRINAA